MLPNETDRGIPTDSEDVVSECQCCRHLTINQFHSFWHSLMLFTVDHLVMNAFTLIRSFIDAIDFDYRGHIMPIGRVCQCFWSLSYGPFIMRTVNRWHWLAERLWHQMASFVALFHQTSVFIWDCYLLKRITRLTIEIYDTYPILGLGCSTTAELVKKFSILIKYDVSITDD